MGTANEILGAQASGLSLMLRPPASPMSSETPASEGTQVGGKNFVALPTNTEESNFSESAAQQDKQQVADAVKNVRDFLQMVRRSLKFTIDEDSGRVVVQIMDLDNNEMIRQIPGENILMIAKELDRFKGLFIEEQA